MKISMVFGRLILDLVGLKIFKFESGKLLEHPLYITHYCIPNKIWIEC